MFPPLGRKEYSEVFYGHKFLIQVPYKGTLKFTFVHQLVCKTTWLSPSVPRQRTTLRIVGIPFCRKFEYRVDMNTEGDHMVGDKHTGGQVHTRVIIHSEYMRQCLLNMWLYHHLRGTGRHSNLILLNQNVYCL